MASPIAIKGIEEGVWQWTGAVKADFASGSSMHGNLSFPIQSESNGIKICQLNGGCFSFSCWMQELKMQQGL